MNPEECSICHSLDEAKSHLERIAQHIHLTCGNRSHKKDFGLELYFIQNILRNIQDAQKYHRVYHATAENDALNDLDLNLQSDPTPQVQPPAPKRFKPWKRKSQ